MNVKLKNKVVAFNEENPVVFVSLILEVKDAKLSWFEELSELEVKNQRVKLNLPNISFKGLAKAIIKDYNARKKPTQYKRELVNIYIKQIGTFYTKS